MPGLVIVGAQWGDEGKGKVVDALASEADVVARFQGGPNAGHTIVVDGERVVLHHVPSGVLHPGVRSVIGPGTLVDPVTLLEEVRGLQARGLLSDPSQLIVDRGCHLILKVHRLLDTAREQAAAALKIGTTGRGIGPCAEDRVGRRGIRFVDLHDVERTRDQLRRNLKEKGSQLWALGVDAPRLPEVLDPVLEAARELGPYLGDAGAVLHASVSHGGRVLYEGAQGTFLDPVHGTYPYVTATPCVAGAAAMGSGVGAAARSGVLGVTKAYTTRVGEGPFPAELGERASQALREAGGEFGATTGRPRRCGWLDLPMLRYAARVNGFTGLAITKLDVLSAVKRPRICVAYEVDGQRTSEWPPGQPAERLKPVLQDVEGWRDDLSEVSDLSDLPPAAAAYVALVEQAVGVRVVLVSVGAERRQTITVQSPWSLAA